ncbi:MAG: terminase small subunit [Pyrinomonadaceae bacterium]
MSEKNKEIKLTGKQKAFCEHYLADAKFNASEAARLAGYSEKTAGSIGHALLKNVEILAYMRELTAANGVNEFQTLHELKDVAYSDWRDHVSIIYDNDGNEKECILMLKDKVKALEILARIQKLMDDKPNVNVGVSVTKVYAGFDLDKV